MFGKNYSVHSVILNEYLTLVQILQVILHSLSSYLLEIQGL